MTAYLIYEGESYVGTGKRREKVVSAKLKEDDAVEYLCKWAAQMDAEIDILDWQRAGSRSGPGYGQIGYGTFNQERWCRYAPTEYNEETS